jgi:hypothetical protein
MHLKGKSMSVIVKKWFGPALAAATAIFCFWSAFATWSQYKHTLAMIASGNMIGDISWPSDVVMYSFFGLVAVAATVFLGTSEKASNK